VPQDLLTPGLSLSLLDDIPLGLVVLDREWCFLYLNPIAERFFEQLSGRTRAQLLGKSIWQECPEVADSTFAKEYRQAAAERRTFELEVYYPALARWFLLLAAPAENPRPIYLQDITARKALERSLHLRLEEMAAADRGKDEFLVHLAHEVRNALAVIQNSTYLAAREGPEAAGPARAASDREIRRLSGLMDNLLKISQLALGRIRPSPGPVDLTEALAQAVQAALGSPAGRGRSFTVNLPAEPLWVQADQGHLEEALTQLLNSTVHGTQVGCRILVEAAPQGGQAVVRVEDDGVGIPAEALPRIFDLFMDGDTALGRTQSGLGTELALVRRLVELQGGAVEAFSEGPGRGSAFTIRLPLAASGDSPGGEPREGKAAARVLVVDNSPPAADSMAQLLNLWGYAARVAYDGPSALEAAEAWDPLVVLLDIGMPGMDGYEVARRLRARPALEGLTLIAVTGYDGEEPRRQSRDAGFDFHLVKPVPPEELKEILDAVGTPG
jgi:signal transduction histidine kinase